MSIKRKSLPSISIFCLVLLLASGIMAAELQTTKASVGEVFIYKIDPTSFNWTNQVMNEQFRYRASLEGYPDLPSWMRYMYSTEYHAGFLYGTPPQSLEGKHLRLDIIALNKQNYETRHMILSIFMAAKFPTPNVIQMKIDNLNWVHLMDPGRVENLRNIFRNELWPESENDLSLIFIESAVNMGGRLPLQPQQREGVIVHLGSFARFSPQLKELQEEVRPLYRLRRVQGSCPYKRTSAQKIFENAGFKLDWCAFKMIGAEISPEILFHNHDSKSFQNSEVGSLKRNDRWQSVSRDEVPVRNYIDEFALAFAIPGVIFAVFLGILSFVLCLEHEKLTNTLSMPHNSSTVHMVQYADDGNNQLVTTSTLKSLKDPKNFLDNISIQSESSNSNTQQIENAPNAYMRPKPPPYKGGGTLRRGQGLEDI